MTTKEVLSDNGQALWKSTNDETSQIPFIQEGYTFYFLLKDGKIAVLKEGMHWGYTFEGIIENPSNELLTKMIRQLFADMRIWQNNVEYFKDLSSK